MQTHPEDFHRLISTLTLSLVFGRLKTWFLRSTEMGYFVTSIKQWEYCERKRQIIAIKSMKDNKSRMS